MMAHMESDRRQLIITAIVFCAFSIITSMTALAFAIGANASSDRKWCSLIITLDEGYNAPVQPGQPKLQERGLRLAADIHNLRKELGCPK